MIDLSDDDEFIIEQHKTDIPIRNGAFYIRSANINDNDALKIKLTEQARLNSHGISYGFIILGGAGSKGALSPGHMLAYFATADWVIFVDIQFLNGQSGEGEPIFTDIAAKYKFANAQQSTDANTFGEFVFYAPMGP